MMEWPYVYVVKEIHDYDNDELLGIFFEREKAQKLFNASSGSVRLIRWDALKGEPEAIIDQK